LEEAMNRVNTDVKLDPDFGKIVPPVDSIYTVEVKPTVRKPYKFILLMPIVNAENEEEALQHALAILLDNDDDFTVKEFPPDTYKSVNKGTIVASFEPDCPDSFIWLCPPWHLRN